MKCIILFFVLFLFKFTLQTPYNWVKCDDGETICFEGFKCCKKAVGYNCCREKEACSPDGETCLTYNSLKTRFEQTQAFRGQKIYDY